MINIFDVLSTTPPKNHAELNVELIYDISSNLIILQQNGVQLTCKPLYNFCINMRLHDREIMK